MAFFFINLEEENTVPVLNYIDNYIFIYYIFLKKNTLYNFKDKKKR